MDCYLPYDNFYILFNCDLLIYYLAEIMCASIFLSHTYSKIIYKKPLLIYVGIPP